MTTSPIATLPSVSNLLTPTQAAEHLGVTVKTLTNWRSLRRGPAHIRIAGRIYYSPDALRAYWAEQTGGAA